MCVCLNDKVVRVCVCDNILCVKVVCVTVRPGWMAGGRRTGEHNRKTRTRCKDAGKNIQIHSEVQKKLGFRTELLVDVVCVTWRAKAVVMATHHRPFPLKNIERRTTQVRKTTDQRSSNVAKLELAC